MRITARRPIFKALKRTKQCFVNSVVRISTKGVNGRYLVSTKLLTSKVKCEKLKTEKDLAKNDEFRKMMPVS